MRAVVPTATYIYLGARSGPIQTNPTHRGPNMADFKVADLSPRTLVVRKSSSLNTKCQASWPCVRSSARPSPHGCTHHRFTAHDSSDCGADRDADSSVPRSAGQAATSSTQDHAAAAAAVGPNGTPEDPRVSPSTRGRARPSRSTGGAPEQVLEWPADASGHTGPNLIR